MTYPEAIDFLYGLRLFGTKLGLENTVALARLCGDPHQTLRFIHVAGTNGKGSVCAMLESVYRASGLRVGLFTSPHLVSFTERLQVNRLCITESDVARLTRLMVERLGADPQHWPFRPTFFEFVTVMALLYFRETACDLVIWETGMGGRVDATNIVTPLASVITNIQFDHEQWLGRTLGEIAREKAGIIKPRVPVISGVDPGEARDVISAVARELDAPIRFSGANSLPPNFAPSLLGTHQRANAAMAVATIEVLQPLLPVAPPVVAAALAHTQWPGRLQLARVGETTVLLDGAHNPDGARALAEALRTHFAGREITLVLGVFQDKAWPEMCRVLIPEVRRVILVPIQSERSVDPAEALAFCHAEWPERAVSVANSVGSGLDDALRFPFVVVAGSLHLVGEAMQHLGIVPAGVSERGLNEWDAARKGDYPKKPDPVSGASR